MIIRLDRLVDDYVDIFAEDYTDIFAEDYTDRFVDDYTDRFADDYTKRFQSFIWYWMRFRWMIDQAAHMCSLI